MNIKFGILPVILVAGVLSLSACGGGSQPDALPTTMGEVSEDAPHAASSDQIPEVQALSAIDAESRKQASLLNKTMEDYLVDTALEANKRKTFENLTKKYDEGETYLEANVDVPDGFEWKYERDAEYWGYTIKVWNPEGDEYKDEKSAITYTSRDGLKSK